MKNAIILFLIILSSIKAFSQEIDSSSFRVKKIKYDTTRIKDLSDKFIIRTGLLGKIHNIELEHKTLNKKVLLEPNGKTSIGIGIHYKWLGLGFNINPGFLNSDNKIYGKTKRFDTQLNIYTRTFGIDAFIQYYKGFYLRNPKDFISWSNESFPLRPDLESFSFGLSGYYFTNHKKFSYKAAYVRNQVQKKSGGSLILGAYFNAHVASAPNGILPSELPDSLSNYFNIDGFITSTLGVSVGYTYTLVIKRFFINGSLVPGLGTRSAEYSLNNELIKTDYTISGSATLRIALGYEGKKIYAGLNLVAFVDNYEYESISISSSTGHLSLVIGKRFETNNWFKKKKKSYY